MKLKKKFFYIVNSATQGSPSKIFKTFLIEDFFPFVTGVNNTGGTP
jgi:hypothetical protein